ncbi:T4 family baseplate hub assembly chaperone [Streptomyces liliifuscus]|uniref:Uncharacterized protein n=1 Tax=Streptomyces liliifuscus TaxID=2797636 RepID=A0A7T7L182_9ACTN|nr:hypothetical protein [Streptomyces liliifuscus]QQM44583.1 hypothetical protein JEQ17_37710 [Streptomyces liliifuscus]
MTISPHLRPSVPLPVGHQTDEGEPLREVTVRKMTGREEALLTDPRLRHNAGKLITALLASCVQTPDGTPLSTPTARRLSSADRNFLLLQLRRTTFGDEMEAHYRCPRCQGMTLVLEDLSTVEVRELPDGEGEMTVELEDGYTDAHGDCHRELVFALPTGEDEETAAARRDANPSRQRDALLARCLRRVGEMEERAVRAAGVRLLSDLSMSDRQLIRRTLDERAPGPELIRTVVCEHCDEEYRSALDMSQFFPLG